MSLLDPTTNPAQTAAGQVVQIIQQQFAALARAGVQGYNAIWFNGSATPQDIIAALGTNAAAVFALAALNIETVQSAATIGGDTAPTIPSIPPEYVLTFNGDGSATLTLASSSSGG